MLDLLNVYNSHAPLNNSRQKSKNNLLFVILTYLWPWNKVKVIKPGMNCWTVSRVIITNSLKHLPYTVSVKNPKLKFSSNQKKNVNYLSWICAIYCAPKSSFVGPTGRRYINISFIESYAHKTETFFGWWAFISFLWGFVDQPIRNLTRAVKTCLLRSRATCISSVEICLAISIQSNSLALC